MNNTLARVLSGQQEVPKFTPKPVETVKDVIVRLAHAESTNEQDDRTTESILRSMGFTKARCVCACVYPEGQGRPMSIQSFFGIVLKKMEESV